MQASTLWHVCSLSPFTDTYIVGLGLGESGKSTIVKRMRIAHQGGFCHDARMAYREAIYSNLLESAQVLAAALCKFQVEPADPSNVVSSSLNLSILASPFNLISCSKPWDACWNTISMRSCSRSHVYPHLPSRASSPRPYTVSGKTKWCQIL